MSDFLQRREAAVVRQIEEIERLLKSWDGKSPFFKSPDSNQMYNSADLNLKLEGLKYRLQQIRSQNSVINAIGRP